MELKLPDIVDSLFKLSKRLGESLVLGTVGLSVAMAELVMHLALGEPLGGWLFAGIAIAVIGYGCAALFAARKRRYESEAGMTFKEAVAKVRDLDGRVEEVEDQLSRYAMDDEADAAKLGASVEQVRSLGETARRILHEMGGLDAAALRDYCSKCVHVAWDGGDRPTWPCNSPSGVPGECFPNLAISTDHLDRLVALGLVSATARIPIGPSGASRMFMRGREYRVTSLSMMTLKTTGEQTVSAFLFPLTGSGVELAALCGAGIGEQRVREVVSYLTSNRMKVEMMVS